MSDFAAAPGANVSVCDVATFDLGTADPDGDWVYYRNSLLFRAGEYVDRDYSMTPEELWAAVEQFSGPVANELDHLTTEGRPLIVEGQLGAVEDVRLSDDANDLYGTVKIPRWLDGVWDRHLAENGGTAKQVSCVWDRDTKTLRKLGLVVKGRVPEAVLMGAYFAAKPSEGEAFFAAAHQTPHGQVALQSIHDFAARAGALCDPASSPAAGGVDYATDGPMSPKFTAANERSHLQFIHDLAVKSGASCIISPRGAASMSDDPPATSVLAPRGSAPSAEAPISSKGLRMSLKDSLKALFGSKPEAAPPDETIDAFLTELVAAKPAPPPAAVATFADSPEAKAMQAKIADLEAKLAAAPPAPTPVVADPPPAPAVPFADSPEAKAMQAKIADLERKAFFRDVNAEAAAFAESEIVKECRATPAERPELVALFTRSKLVDQYLASASVTFAAEGETAVSMVEMVKSLFAKRPKHALMREFVNGADIPVGSSVLFHNATPVTSDVPTQERIDKLLSMTPEGTLAIKMRKQNGAL